MNELFEINEDEYLRITNDLSHDLNQYISISSDSSEKEDLEEGIERNLSNAKKQIDRMESEMNGESDYEIRKSLVEKLETYTKEWKKHDINYKSTKQVKDRESLFGQDKTESIDVSGDEEGKQKLANNTNMLRNQTDTINKMRTIGIEMNEEANETLIRLGQQTDQIDGQINKTDEITDKVHGARAILSRMTRRQIYTSIIFIVIILVLIGIIALILFLVIRPYLPNLSGSGSGSS
eukprot:gene7758-12228_t